MELAKKFALDCLERSLQTVKGLAGGTPQQFENHCDYKAIRIFNILRQKNPSLLTACA
jgi:hypothetical protein